MPSSDLPGKNRIPLLVIVGPTAVGKTALALRVAEKVGGEIVSADSRLFYHGMDIGTAKPTRQEQASVPHHLIDVAAPDDSWSLTKFQEAAKAAIADIDQRGKLAILVGGTGQYVKAVIEGWEPPDQPPDGRLRPALERLAEQVGADELHRRLAIIDPEAAGFIEAPNVRRTIRALEVIFSSGKRFSEQRRRGESPYRLLVVGLRRPRSELYARIDQRITSMLDEGLLDEVKALLDKGYSPDLPTLSAIGYREMCKVLQDEMSLEEAIMWMKRLTRRYVRQQGNWFRETDPSIHWFDAIEGVENHVIALVENWRDTDS